MDTIEGVTLTKLQQIPTPKGAVFHGLKASEKSFQGFGEAYFSFIAPNQVKGWKKHTRITLNLIVICGEIEFIIYDLRENSSTYGKTARYRISRENYQRLTLPPGLWFAFKGIRTSENILLDIINEEHDPEEGETRPLETFPVTL